MDLQIKIVYHYRKKNYELKPMSVGYCCDHVEGKNDEFDGKIFGEGV